MLTVIDFHCHYCVMCSCWCCIKCA